LFTTQLGTLVNKYGLAMDIDNQSNIYVTGDTEGSFDGHSNSGNKDIFLVKFFDNGTKDWSIQMGSNNWDIAMSVVVDNNDYIYISGNTRGNFDGHTLKSEQDGFILKFDGSGNKIWSATHPNRSGRGITVDSNGDIYVTGTGHPLRSTSGTRDAYIEKHSTVDGSSIWVDQISTSGYDDSGNQQSIVLDSNNNIYVTGITDGTFSGNTNAGSSDSYLIKYDASGARVYSKQFGSNAVDAGRALGISSSNELYLVGFTDGVMVGNASLGGRDIFVVKLYDNGTSQWTKQYGTNGSDEAGSIEFTNDGFLLLSGLSDGAFDNYTNQGGDDAFILKLDSDGNLQ